MNSVKNRVAGLRASIFLVPISVFAQGTRADYERAAKFLPPNVHNLVDRADGTPH
jgi:hypothetical protein